MTTPQFINLQYSYKKPDTDVWVLNWDDIPVDPELIKDRQIVHLGPGAVGGNHKHPRTEWFVGIGELLLIWIDGNGERHEAEMCPQGQIRLITVSPFLPHAVVNKSNTQPATLFEMADQKQTDVEQISVY